MWIYGYFSLYVACSTSKCKQDNTNLSKHVIDLGSVHFHNVNVFCKNERSVKYPHDVGGFEQFTVFNSLCYDFVNHIFHLYYS